MFLLPNELVFKLFTFLNFNDLIKLYNMPEFIIYRLELKKIINKNENEERNYRNQIINTFLIKKSIDKIENYQLGIDLDSGRWPNEGIISTLNSIKFHKDQIEKLKNNEKIDTTILSLKNNDKLNNYWNSNPTYLNYFTYYCKVPRS